MSLDLPQMVGLSDIIPTEKHTTFLKILSYYFPYIVFKNMSCSRNVFVGKKIAEFSGYSCNIMWNKAVLQTQKGSRYTGANLERNHCPAFSFQLALCACTQGVRAATGPSPLFFPSITHRQPIDLYVLLLPLNFKTPTFLRFIGNILKFQKDFKNLP